MFCRRGMLLSMFQVRPAGSLGRAPTDDVNSSAGATNATGLISLVNCFSVSSSPIGRRDRGDARARPSSYPLMTAVSVSASATGVRMRC